MEEVLKLQAQIKEIKAQYQAQREEIIRKRQDNYAKIDTLLEGIEIIKKQIKDIHKDNKVLGNELTRVEHEVKVVTLPLRTQVWRYMEALRKEIRAHEEVDSE